MTTRMPPELMSAEEREARAAELEREIAHEWLRFAITEAVVIWLPFALFGVVYASSDAISDTELYVVSGMALAACTILVLYWLFSRVRPRQEELAAIRRHAQ
jgi:hypothetical protein